MTDNLHLIRSAFTGMKWPRLPDHAGALALAMQYQLEQTQWWPAAELERHQLRQLRLLLQHASESVPFHHLRLAAAGFDPASELTLEQFRALPRMNRRDIQTHGKALLSTAVPGEHGRLASGETSGSTGAPVTYYGTELTQLFWRACNLRDHVWHKRDHAGTMAAIRKFEAGEQAGWGPSLDVAYMTGRTLMFHIRNDLDAQLDWLQRGAPDYLISNAYNVYWLARRSMERGLALSGLRAALCFGGTFPEDARDVVRRAWNVPLTDVYTAEEVGYIALQCPVHEHYHVQSENLIVEILGKDGQPCRPGEIGVVVLTTLHNFAMPLIRYEIGDYAEAGAACPCGRGLPVIGRILGRQRNILTLADGRRRWPSFPSDQWSYAAPVRQVQLIQKSLERIVVRAAADRALTAEEEREFLAAIGKCLGHPFRLELERVPEISRSASLKFEDFVSEIA